jgi:hypothetical protein
MKQTRLCLEILGSRALRSAPGILFSVDCHIAWDSEQYSASQLSNSWPEQSLVSEKVIQTDSHSHITYFIEGS